MAYMALALFAVLCGSPGAFMLYKWHDGIVALILGGALCLTGILGGSIFCLRKCSPVVQGMLLLRIILAALLCLGMAVAAVVLWSNDAVRDYFHLLLEAFLLE
jgi:hypothetical protein